MINMQRKKSNRLKFVLDCLNMKLSTSEVATINGVTNGYVSQTRTKIAQLRHPVEFNEKKEMICWKCKKVIPHYVMFHHNHDTGELIAAVCGTCNRYLKSHTNDEDFIKLDRTFRSYFYFEVPIELWNSIHSSDDVALDMAKMMSKFKDHPKFNEIKKQHPIALQLMKKYDPSF
jgi:hypothetical protein